MDLIGGMATLAVSITIELLLGRALGIGDMNLPSLLPVSHH